LMNGLDWAAALKDLQALIDHLHNTGSTSVGITGFCMGGALTLAAASNLRGLKAAVPFYGIPPQLSEGKIFVPIQGHFAKHDDWCTVAKVEELGAKLKAAHANYEFHIYDAHHAFCNEKRTEVYSPVHAQQAFDRTFAFFGQHLL
jgi:carboxymethylenebutenolidase